MFSFVAFIVGSKPHYLARGHRRYGTFAGKRQRIILGYWIGSVHASNSRNHLAFMGVHSLLSVHQ